MTRMSGDSYSDWAKALDGVAEIKDIRKGAVVPIADFKTAENVEAEKMISALGLNSIQRDRVGDTSNGKPVYLVQYVWQTMYSPADLERHGLKVVPTSNKE